MHRLKPKLIHLLLVHATTLLRQVRLHSREGLPPLVVLGFQVDYFLGQEVPLFRQPVNDHLIVVVRVAVLIEVYLGVFARLACRRLGLGALRHSELVLVLDFPDALVVVGLDSLDLRFQLLHSLGFRSLARAFLVLELKSLHLLAVGAQFLVEFGVFGVQVALQLGELALVFGGGLVGVCVFDGLEHHGDAVGVLGLDGFFQHFAFLFQVAGALGVVLKDLDSFPESQEFFAVSFLVGIVFLDKALILPEPSHFVFQFLDLRGEIVGGRVEVIFELLEFSVLVID